MRGVAPHGPAPPGWAGPGAGPGGGGCVAGGRGQGMPRPPPRWPRPRPGAGCSGGHPQPGGTGGGGVSVPAPWDPSGGLGGQHPPTLPAGSPLTHLLSGGSSGPCPLLGRCHQRQLRWGGPGGLFLLLGVVEGLGGRLGVPAQGWACGTVTLRGSGGDPNTQGWTARCWGGHLPSATGAKKFWVGSRKRSGSSGGGQKSLERDAGGVGGHPGVRGGIQGAAGGSPLTLGVSVALCPCPHGPAIAPRAWGRMGGRGGRNIWQRCWGRGGLNSWIRRRRIWLWGQSVAFGGRLFHICPAACRRGHNIWKGPIRATASVPEAPNIWSGSHLLYVGVAAVPRTWGVGITWIWGCHSHIWTTRLPLAPSPRPNIWNDTTALNICVTVHIQDQVLGFGGSNIWI